MKNVFSEEKEHDVFFSSIAVLKLFLSGSVKIVCKIVAAGPLEQWVWDIINEEKCVSRKSNPDQLLGRQLCYRYTTHASALQTVIMRCNYSSSQYLLSARWDSELRRLPSRTLRSQDTCLLAVPRTKTVFGSRAFRVAAPTVFNSLPQDIRSTDNISTFCRLLKTFYFRNAFDQH